MKVFGMNDIEFVDLFKIEEEKIIGLMNNDSVKKHLPLLKANFTQEDCRFFLNAKHKLWDEYGYGPYALIIKGAFAGWGGLQPDGNDADVALVLHPSFWGWGRKIFNIIKSNAFSEMKLPAITALLPANRSNLNAIKRLGFIADGQREIDDKIFFRFRLFNPSSNLI